MNDKDLTIYQIYKMVKQPDRDDKITDKIAIYFKNNALAITDGIIRDVPKISAAERDKIAVEYNIGRYEWDLIKRRKEFKNMAKLGTPLNIGLIISYLETKDRVFLTYLFILMYSSVYMKYMTKGSHNPLVMKYTIDTSDNRTDFKRYECSLIAVVNKKVEAFIQNYKVGLNNDKHWTDKFIRELVQASKTRINEMFKNLYGKYKANLKDPNVKLMMEYSETPDGKHVLSMQNIFETLKDNASQSLFTPSDQVLGSIGLSSKNVENLRYRSIVIKNFSDVFSYMSMANSLIIDKWVIQNANRLTMDNFKATFIKSMMNGRNISHIYDKIDEAVEIMIKNDAGSGLTYNKIVLRNFLYSYLVLNIYMTSTKVF